MSKVLEKLKKLITHEESARSIGNVAEAEAFAAKIQDLLDRNNLSMSDVEIHSARASEIDADLLPAREEKFDDWRCVLAQTVSKINGCTSLVSPVGMIFIGRKSDRDIAISLYLYFEKLGLELAENYRSYRPMISGYLPLANNGYTYSVKGNPSDKELNSYLLGFTARVSDRLNEIHNKNRSQTENRNALVFVNSKFSDSEDFAREIFNPEEATMPEPDDVDLFAFRQGMRKGDSIALTDKVIEQN